MTPSIKKIVIRSLLGLSVLSFVFFADPVVTSAQTLVPCDGAADCDWNAFISMINEVIKTLMIIATSVAMLLFTYAGFLYLTSRGDESQVKQATTIFTNVAVGFAIMLLAWLIVGTIVSLLTGEGISTFI